MKVKVAQLCLTLRPHGLCSPWNSPGQNTGVGSLSLLQEIFPTQGLNPGLLHCKRILYQLSQKGSPRKLEWVAYPFCRGSSQPRSQSRVSCIAGRFFTNWAIREALKTCQLLFKNSIILPGVVFQVSSWLHPNSLQSNNTHIKDPKYSDIFSIFSVWNSLYHQFCILKFNLQMIL